MAEIISHSEEINLPVVPLRGMVAFPSVPMSIEVAREKSVGAIRVAERLGGCIMLITQTDVSVDKPTPDDLYRVGTIAKIKQSVKRRPPPPQKTKNPPARPPAPPTGPPSPPMPASTARR